MKTEFEIPKDATHYFFWWDGIHVYKKEGKDWFHYTDTQWFECWNLSHHYIKRGLFSYYQVAGNFKHKLHKIQKGAKCD